MIGRHTVIGRCNMNTKGITLIELIVSLCIVLIVAAPFLGTFLASTKNNAASKEVLMSSTLASKVMEEIKSRPLFLSTEAVTEAEASLMDYREYMAYEDYKVKYRIIKEEGVVSPLSQTYEFEKINDLIFGMEYTVDSGRVILNGIPYNLNFNATPVLFFLEINETSGSYSYRFYDENSTELQSGSIDNIVGTDPLRIKVNYINGSSDIFLLNVNIDGIVETRDVCFYIVDDKHGALSLYNTGTKPFYQLFGISGQHVDYFNVLYRIEIIVEKKNRIVNRLLSYVKKIR